MSVYDKHIFYLYCSAAKVFLLLSASIYLDDFRLIILTVKSNQVIRKRLKNGFVTILTTYEKSNSTNKENMKYRLSE